MFLIGEYLARYIDWCAALSRKMRPWQILVIEVSSFVGFVLCVELLPGWLAVGYLFVIAIPVGIFAFSASRDKRKRAETVCSLQTQNRKTRKLLERFRHR
ncbi:conserved hypothetical protein [Ruegeria sp. TrichCH4B]|nr:conserved hypothetical protein [Ruegeria sp. TrichCH4B]